MGENRTGRRIPELMHLTKDQDRRAVDRYMSTDPDIQSMPPTERANWKDQHSNLAKDHGTTVAEQLAITQEIADGRDGTSKVNELVVRLANTGRLPAYVLILAPVLEYERGEVLAGYTTPNGERCEIRIDSEKAAPVSRERAEAIAKDMGIELPD